jgi:hypothetical protein
MLCLFVVSKAENLVPFSRYFLFVFLDQILSIILYDLKSLPKKFQSKLIYNIDSRSGLPDFPSTTYQNGKNIQMTLKLTKWS